MRSAESDIHNSDRPAEPDKPDISTSQAEAIGKVTDDIEETQEPLSIGSSEEVTAGPIPPEDARESISIMRAITNLWADRSAALWKPLEYPLYYLVWNDLT